MPIRVQCTKCGNQYSAPDAMLGRRVRCKKCGEVFVVGNDSDESVNIDDLQAGDSLSETASGVTRAQNRDPTAEFEEAFRDFEPSARRNTAFKFPNAALLDEWVPYLSVGLALLCLGIVALSVGADFPAWVGFLRAGLFSVLFLIIVHPLTWKMVQRAAVKLKFELPPAARWRTCAAFAFPFAFACLLWIKSEDLAGLITGGVVGLLLGLAMIWLLIRLQQDELSTALRLAAGGFIAGMIISVSVLLFANMFAREMINSLKHRTTFASSPIAPGFEWATPQAPARSGRAIDDSSNQGSTGTQTPSDNPSPSTAPTSQPDGVATSEPTDLFSDSSLFGDKHLTTKPVSSSSTPHVSVAAPDPDPPGPEVGVTHPDTRPSSPLADSTDAFVQGIRESHSPLVASVTPVTQDSGFSEFYPPITASPWALLVSSDKDTDREIDDAIDVWCMSPTPARRFQRSRFRAQVNRDYIVSPDGSSMLRIVTFPRLAIEIWNNVDGVVEKLLTLPPDHGGAKATLLGFLSEDHILLRWHSDRADVVGLEVWDIKTGRPARPIILPSHVQSPANWCVSPDGKFYATVIRGTDKTNKPQLAVFGLAGSVGNERMTITDMDPQFAIDPAAIAFSPDNKKVAAMFEHEGDVAIYNWRLSDRKLTGPQLFPDGTLPTGFAKTSSTDAVTSSLPNLPSRQVRQFAWLANNNAWLLRGDVVVDSEGGRVIGKLGTKGVVDQWVSGNTCLLIYRQRAALRMVDLQLKTP